MVARDRSPITDSPWFWVMAFSLMSLLALAAMSGKYGRRQAGLERQYQARERVAAGETGPTAGHEHSRPRAFAAPGENLIPLWPLAALMAVTAAAAGIMLYRSQERAGPPNEAPQ